MFLERERERERESNSIKKTDGFNAYNSKIHVAFYSTTPNQRK